MKTRIVFNVPLSTLKEKICLQSLKEGARVPKSIAYNLRKKNQETFNEMLETFRHLDITREILNGNNSKNISGTLSGYGNLFSFIGFDEGSDPIGDLENSILSSFKNEVRYEGYPRKSMKYRISQPDKNIIFSADNNPIPWQKGRSWIDGIEHGISGLGYYLSLKNGKRSGRSGTGIQQKTTRVRSGGFKNKGYISPLLKEYIKHLKNKIRQK